MQVDNRSRGYEFIRSSVVSESLFHIFPKAQVATNKQFLTPFSGTIYALSHGVIQCCAILIGIGAKSVLKSKIFDTFGIVSVLVLKEVCNRYWYWSRYCKKSLRGIGIGIGIET